MSFILLKIRHASFWSLVLVVALSFVENVKAYDGAGDSGDITKEANARSNDIASKYVLYKNGDFFRYVRGQKCQITNLVRSFKVSNHPNDLAMIYFERENTKEKVNDLYYLKNNPLHLTGDCPPVEKAVMMSNVKKYSVVSNTSAEVKTEIVNVAISNSGIFTAWTNRVKPYSYKDRALDYVMHQKFGVAEAPFNSYVAFVIDRDGFVLKVKGKDPENSKLDLSDTYTDLQDFKRSNKID